MPATFCKYQVSVIQTVGGTNPQMIETTPFIRGRLNKIWYRPPRHPVQNTTRIKINVIIEFPAASVELTTVPSSSTRYRDQITMMATVATKDAISDIRVSRGCSKNQVNIGFEFLIITYNDH